MQKTQNVIFFQADENFTYAVNPGNLQVISEQVAVLKKWCFEYFDKLKLLATLVQTLLEELQENDEGHSFLQRINNLHLDLNKTMDQVGGMFFEFESKLLDFFVKIYFLETERSIKEAIEQSINQTNYQNRTTNDPGFEKEVSIASSVSELQNRTENLAKIEQLRSENTKLNEKLHEVLDEKEDVLLEKRVGFCLRFDENLSIFQEIEKELLNLRDDLQNQREAIDGVRAELEDASHKYRTINVDFENYRKSTEEENKVGFGFFKN